MKVNNTVTVWSSLYQPNPPNNLNHNSLENQFYPWICSKRDHGLSIMHFNIAWLEIATFLDIFQINLSKPAYYCTQYQSTIYYQVYSKEVFRNFVWRRANNAEVFLWLSENVQYLNILMRKNLQ